MLDDADQELLGDMMLSTRPVILGPNITGAAKFDGAFNGGWSSNGALAGSGGNGRTNTGGGYGDDNNLYIYFNASNSNAIYKDTTVQPSSLVLNYIIKY